MAQDTNIKQAMGGPIINELLCWFQNMITVIGEPQMIKLCCTKFDEMEIVEACDLLLNLLVSEADKPRFRRRLSKKVSDSVSVKSLKEIFQLFQEYGNFAPNFVAMQLDKLPPIDYSCADVSGLLIKFKKMESRFEYILECSKSSNASMNTMRDTQLAVLDRIVALESRKIDDNSENLVIDDVQDNHIGQAEIITDKSFQCPESVNTAVVEASLPTHTSTHTKEKPFLCTGCDITLDDKSSLSDGENSKCEKCALVDRNAPNQASANQVTHAVADRFYCTICDFKCNENHAYDEHMRNHSNEKPHTCSLCNLNVSSRPELITHMAEHTPDKTFTCTECDFKSIEKQTIENHMQNHKGEKPVFVTPCPMCTAIAPNDAALWKHLRNHSFFKCPKCKYTTENKLDLKKHMLTHTGETDCSQSDGDFGGKEKTLEIEKCSSTKDKQLICKECGFKTHSQQTLASHKHSCKNKSHHSNDKFGNYPLPKQTNHPSKTADFDAGEQLNANIYVCMDCDFNSPSRATTKSHMLKHRPPKVFICEDKDCTFECSSRDVLQGHVISHHKPISMPNANQANDNIHKQPQDPWIGPLRNGKPIKSQSQSYLAPNTFPNGFTHMPTNKMVQTQQANQSTPKGFITGSNNKSSLSNSPKPHMAKMFATHYRSGTVPEDVKRDLETNLQRKTGKVYSVQVEELPTRYNSYCSFRISCLCVNSEIFMDNKLWPDNVSVRWFVDKRYKDSFFTRQGSHNHHPSSHHPSSHRSSNYLSPNY